MQRNWPVIVGLIAFIVGYSFFLPSNPRPTQGPVNELSNTSPAAQSEATPNQAPNQGGATRVSSNDSANQNPGQSGQSELTQAWQGRAEFALSPTRIAHVFGSGVIGDVVLADFKKRKSEENVRISENGWRWYSSDSAVNECLARLDRAGGDSELRFVGRHQEGTCEVTFAAQEGAPAGTFLASVKLEGFARSKGQIVFGSEERLGDSTDPNTLVYYADGTDHWVRDKDLFQPLPATEIPTQWVAMGGKYFVSMAKPEGQYLARVRIENQSADPAPTEQRLARFGLAFHLDRSKQDLVPHYSAQIYFGTRDPDILKALAANGERAMDYGFFASIAGGLLWLLKAINQWTHNFGISIIILTLLVRLVFWPLNKKVYISSLKMKAIQPEMEAIRKRYGNDKERAMQMNTEVFALYKKHGVNPVGSCLPMLAQMPVFFALYQALSHSLDLYQAPFMFWITDLSSPDRFYILSILWTVSLMGYVWMNPQTASPQPGMPNMTYIMYGMNLFIGVLSVTWPSGLCVYLVVSNLVGLAQQILLRKKSSSLIVIQEGAKSS